MYLWYAVYKYHLAFNTVKLVLHVLIGLLFITNALLVFEWIIAWYLVNRWRIFISAGLLFKQFRGTELNSTYCLFTIATLAISEYLLVTNVHFAGRIQEWLWLGMGRRVTSMRCAVWDFAVPIRPYQYFMPLFSMFKFHIWSRITCIHAVALNKGTKQSQSLSSF